jgi:hypothetical protein
MTTVHATTSTQMTTDGPSRKTGEVDVLLHVTLSRLRQVLLKL